MARHIDKRKQIMWKMVAYLQGVVDAIADKDAMVRVNSAMGDFYAQLDDLEREKASSGA